MKKLLILTVAAASCSSLLLADSAQERLRDSAAVFREIMSAPDQGIPQDLLNKASCVVVVPGLKKGAFIVGGEFGKGFVVCRRRDAMGWEDPAAIRVEGGSVGFQIGGQSTDVVMLIMNEGGMRNLEKDKFTLGADASVAAGPVGRTAEANTDAYMHAEILAWSRTRGVFAGVALKGATLRPDMDENKQLYGQRLTTREVLHSHMATPQAARPLIAELDRYSMRKQG
ncbi:MAG TPA: lipid-binding SYLF domain-containing protein [Bryobacteraceae bacterium]|nr:lipid-binding SYLF domain-containing protein [Bryobacteraceae bacterium]